MTKVDNKVEPINVIDIESHTLYLDQSKEFASSNPDGQINQKNDICISTCSGSGKWNFFTSLLFMAL